MVDSEEVGSIVEKKEKKKKKKRGVAWLVKPAANTNQGVGIKISDSFEKDSNPHPLTLILSYSPSFLGTDLTVGEQAL